jgi:hypothetical protein
MAQQRAHFAETMRAKRASNGSSSGRTRPSGANGPPVAQARDPRREGLRF